jgi:hypothetical protein
MSVVVTAESIRAFASRERASVAHVKRDHWASAYRQGGSDATIAIARSLFNHAVATVEGFPRATDRARDLEDHVMLKTRLDRASNAHVAVR